MDNETVNKIHAMRDLAESLSHYERYVVSNSSEADAKREQFRSHLQTLMEQLQDMSTTAQYLQLDIEALRRENAALRAKLGES